jgi:hypothetical protein
MGPRREICAALLLLAKKQRRGGSLTENTEDTESETATAADSAGTLLDGETS